MALVAVLCLPCHDAVTTPIPVDPAISPLTDTRFRPSAGGLGPQLTVASDNGQWLRGRRSKRGEDRRSTRRDTRAESNRGGPELKRSYPLDDKKRRSSAVRST
jgi:hypothetical protein